MSAETPFLLAVMGPTASGKTDLAERLAEETSAQLINADAFQVYRGFDIGTAKSDNKDRYSLVDIRDPGEAFGVGEFVQLAASELAELYARRQNAIVVGGTGLYVRALFEQYSAMLGQPDPRVRTELEARESTEGVRALFEQLQATDSAAAALVDPLNPVRVRRALEKALSPSEPIRFELPPFRKLKVGLSLTPKTLNERIERRLDRMLHNGWIGEVSRLREEGVTFDAPAMRGIGYRTIWGHLDGDISLLEARGAILTDMCRYAKRQRTWIRTEPSLIVLDAEVELPLQRAIDLVS